MISLILADDHSLYIDGLELLLTKGDDFKVVTKCNSGAEAISVLKKRNCDILLLDLHLTDMTGLEIVEEIQKFKPEQKILMLTHQKGSRFLSKLEKLGIKGYLLKNITKEELIKALKIVYEGGTYFSEGIQNITKEEDFYIKSSVILSGDTPEIMLTAREKEILVFVCNELSSAEIAKKLFISIGTVDTHRKNILQKLGISNTVGLVKYALKHGLLNTEE
ncbi:MAG: response regulator transcription factor [Bacteroidia bacterium]|nr:response regulator transcription factor [Bacteroidia bacterium]